MSTPSDLSARLLACPFCGGAAERIDFGPGSGDNEGGSCIACTKCQASGPVEFGYKENFVSNWNRRAALSALPAAGGLAPVLTAYRCDYCGRDYYDTANCCESRREYLAAFTTPQPSAAEGECTNCGRPKRADRAIDACACASLTYTPPPDAAVGTQGDGARLLSIIDEWMDNYDHMGTGCRATERNSEREWKKDRQEIEQIIRRLTAPAAGKGVDDAMTDAEIEQWIGACNYGKARDTLRHYLQLRSALTRQPVAGDGMVLRKMTHQMVLAANEHVPVISGCPVLTYGQVMEMGEAMLAAAPAATPTKDPNQ